MDGGFKYNVLGWPCTITRVANPAMNFAPTAIMLSSGLSAAQVEEGLRGYAEKVKSVTGMSPARLFTMSDAEQAYRVSSAEAFSDHSTQCNTLRCWFHVT